MASIANSLAENVSTIPYKLIGNLPHEVGMEILSFIINDSTTVRFRSFSVYSNNLAYNPRYQVAFIGENLVKNKNGEYLSRISKKNGKHRYYLTKECRTFCCGGCGANRPRKLCVEYCGADYIYDYTYTYESTYVGKNIDKALIELFIRDSLLE